MTIMRAQSESKAALKTEAPQKTWQIIRGLGSFTYDEVATLTELPYPVVSKYLLTLYQAGYIAQAGKRKEPDGRRKVVWRLAKNTGPKPPIPCRCLYDPNVDGLAEVKHVD